MSFLLGFCGDNSNPQTIESNTENTNSQNRLLLNDSTKNNAHYDESLIVAKDEEITKLSRQNNSYKKQITDLETELNETKQKYSDFEQECKALQQQINQLINEYQQKLAISEKQINNLNKSKSELMEETNRMHSEIDNLNAQIVRLKEEKEDKKQKKQKKEKLIYTESQISIAMNEGLAALSMLLCCKSAIVIKDGINKDFSFLKFLETDLSDKAVNQLFIDKFKSDSIDDGQQLLSILTLTTIIYKVKLYQLRTGNNSKPKMESNKIKKMVQHLTVYIIRKYGKQKTEKEDICIKDQNGKEIINGAFYGFQFSVTKDQFAANISSWIQSYIEDEGHIQLE